MKTKFEYDFDDVIECLIYDLIQKGKIEYKDEIHYRSISSYDEEGGLLTLELEVDDA